MYLCSCISDKQSQELSVLLISAYMSVPKMSWDNHYLKLQGIPNQTRHFGPVDRKGVDVLAQLTLWK